MSDRGGVPSPRHGPDVPDRHVLDPRSRDLRPCSTSGPSAKPASPTSSTPTTRPVKREKSTNTTTCSKTTNRLIFADDGIHSYRSRYRRAQYISQFANYLLPFAGEGTVGMGALPVSGSTGWTCPIILMLHGTCPGGVIAEAGRASRISQPPPKARYRSTKLCAEAPRATANLSS